MTDHPPPGRGYLALLLALLLLGTGTGIGLILTENGALTRALIALLFAAPLTVLGLLPLHAAFHTRYDLTDHSLALRAGLIIKANLQWTEIDEVVQVPFIPRVLGWGGGRGLANRLTNGVRITTRQGSIYYISPTDPEQFVQEVQNATNKS